MFALLIYIRRTHFIYTVVCTYMLLCDRFEARNHFIIIHFVWLKSPRIKMVQDLFFPAPESDHIGVHSHAIRF